MNVQRNLLLGGLAAGALAVVAGLVGVSWLAGGAAATLLMIFLIVPWMRPK